MRAVSLLHVLVTVLMGVSISCSTGSRHAQWRQLLEGQELSRWSHVGAGRMVDDGGALKTEGGMGLLWYTPEKFGNVVLRVVYRNPGGANSGIFIRIPEAPTDPWMPVHRGYEVQIDDRGDDYHGTGGLYSLTKVAARPSLATEWNTMEITLAGDRTIVHINGLLVTDYTEGESVPERKEEWEPERGPRPRIGFIGLQNHGKGDTVYFREVSVRDLERD